MALATRFQEHPASVDETYGEHLRVAFGFARGLAKASAAAMVHAVFPFWCCTTASEEIKRLNDKVTSGKRGEVLTPFPPLEVAETPTSVAS